MSPVLMPGVDFGLKYQDASFNWDFFSSVSNIVSYSSVLTANTKTALGTAGAANVITIWSVVTFLREIRENKLT